MLHVALALLMALATVLPGPGGWASVGVQVVAADGCHCCADEADDGDDCCDRDLGACCSNSVAGLAALPIEGTPQRCSSTGDALVGALHLLLPGDTGPPPTPPPIA